MYGYEKQQVKICSFNPRAEKHGEENVLAADLKIETICHSSQLDHFDSSLRALLYRKPSQGEQTTMEFQKGDELTERRMPNLKPLALDEDFPGYEIHIDSGLALDETLKLHDVELSKFSFEAMEGGSVKIVHSASFHPDGRLSGKLCQLIQETVTLTLIPPTKKDDAQQDMAA